MINNIDKVAVVDLDDTINDLRIFLSYYLNKVTGKSIHWTEWTGIDLLERYEIESELFQKTVLDHYIFERSRPEKHAIEAMQLLDEKGYRIHIMTARAWMGKELASRITGHWLKMYGIPFKSVIITHFHEGKTATVERQFGQVAVMIDDQPRHLAHDLAERKILISRPWNSGIPGNWERHPRLISAVRAL